MKTLFRKRKGQAISEFVIGMLGISIMFFGLLQVANLGVGGHSRNGNIQNYKDARAEAEEFILIDASSFEDGTNIGSWGDGNDGLRFTADDSKINQNGDYFSKFQEELSDPTTIEELMTDVSEYDSMSERLERSTVWATGLQSGKKSSSVSVEPALRSFLFNTLRTIHISDEVFMPTLNLGNPDAVD